MLHVVKNFDASARESILAGFRSIVTIPEHHVAAMKSTLNLPWSLLRDVRRWLKTFKVNLTSEMKARNVVKECNGCGLREEEIPATVIKSLYQLNCALGVICSI